MTAVYVQVYEYGPWKKLASMSLPALPLPGDGIKVNNNGNSGDYKVLRRVFEQNGGVLLLVEKED